MLDVVFGKRRYEPVRVVVVLEGVDDGYLLVGRTMNGTIKKQAIAMPQQLVGMVNLPAGTAPRPP